jgi:hypothetical protein
MFTRQKTMLLLIFCMLIPFAANSHVHAAQTAAVKSPSTSYQFGGAPFDPEQSFNEFNGILKVQEQGDYTIVTWSDIYSTDGQRLYMSVAKNSKWLFRGKEVLAFDDTGDDSSKSIIAANNYIFYGDDKSLEVATIHLEDGEISSPKTLRTWDKPAGSIPTKRYYYPIKTNDRSGVMYKVEEGKYEIFLGGELSKPLIIDDPKRVIKRHITSDIVLTSKRDRLIFVSGHVTTVFNIKKKDMQYNAKGYEQVHRNIQYYDGGRLYGFSPNDLSSIQTLDENFKGISTVSFKAPAASRSYFAGITVSNNALRFWSFHSYRNTNSLQVTSFKLGKEPS